MLKLSVVTLFPQLIESFLKEMPYKKALSKKLIDIEVINLRDFSKDKHHTVDAKPYGGGVGMLLMIEPLFEALCTVVKNNADKKERKIIVFTPKGSIYKQETAQSNTSLEHLILVCGRYEGIDERIFQLNALKETPLAGISIEGISIGEYVLTGGEVAALAVMESTVRLIEGVLEKEEATRIESFSGDEKYEYPQFTRPENFKGLKVPEILLSGNHKEIDEWRKKN